MLWVGGVRVVAAVFWRDLMSTLLSVNNYYYRRGGAETVFFEHGRLFEGIGWTVVPFSMRHQSNLETPWSEHFVDEIEFGESYSLGQKLTRVSRVIYSFQAKQCLGRLLDTIHVDVCHAHNIYHHLSPSILGSLRRRGIPTVLTLHDLKIACPAYTMLARDGICERCRGGRLYNVALHRCIKDSAALSAIVMLEALLHKLIGSYSRCVSRFVVPSRFYAMKLSEWGVPDDMFRHVPNFVDVNRYEPSYRPGDRIVYFGRLSREKGLHTLVRAAAASKTKVAIAGVGAEEEALIRLARRLGADVEFPGFLMGERLHEFVRSARAVVLPSEWYENAPMSVLEAYALGKPVIGARIGGIPELIRENETGYQFASGEIEALTDILLRVAAGPAATLEEMGRRGRRWVEADFTAEVYRERILAVYRDLGVDAVPGARLSASHPIE